MYILKPKQKERPIFKNLPIYILFGDSHRSNDNVCGDEDQKSPVTFNVYDIKFLSLLHPLSSPEQPIDFFIEGGDFHNRTFNQPHNSTYPL